MSQKRLDCRGLDCPQPVIETRQALDEFDSVDVVLDDATAADNVCRMAENSGFAVKREDKDEEIILHISGGGDEMEKAAVAKSAAEGDDAAFKPVANYLITTSRLGEGPDELGEMLMEGFLRTLLSVEPKPRALIFINEGVKLVTVRGSTAEIVQELEEAGCEILACGTCLDYFDLKDELAAGNVSNMHEIVSKISSADTIRI